MSRKKYFGIMLLFMIPLLINAQQTKPLVKLEMQAGMGLLSEDFSVFLPAVYIPIHQHIELGANYNILKITYSGKNYNQILNQDEFFKGSVKYRFPSFYIKLNTSKDFRRCNVFLGYIYSLVKGTHKEELIGRMSTDGYDDLHGSMTADEETQLNSALEKTKSAHGGQVGIDFKIIQNLSVFIKGAFFTFSGATNPIISNPNSSGSNPPDPMAFPFYYISNTYYYNAQPYCMVGFIIKFYDKSNKKLIK